MFRYIIITVLIIYIFYKNKKFNTIIKELTEQNGNIEATLIKTLFEYNKKDQQIFEYKRKLAIKGRLSLFDSITKNE